MGNKVTILGARGSVPVNGSAFSRYGGATSCVLLETESEVLLFDAGTGILNLPEQVWKKHRRVHIFMTHSHLDHIMGIPMCSMMFDPKVEVIFYSPDVEKFQTALKQLMNPPLWPVGTDVFKAQIRCKALGKEPYLIKGAAILVSQMPVAHPGGSFAYRVEWGEHSVVYATDCELDAKGCKKMIDFAENAGLLILDAQYTAEEYQTYKGYGHSDVDTAASVIVGCGAQQGLLFHHAPTRTDEQLDQIETYVKEMGTQIGIAKEGDQINL